MHVKDFLAGKRGICPKCQQKVEIPTQSESEFAAVQGEADLISLAPPGGATSTAAQAPLVAAPAPAAFPAQAGPTPQPNYGGAAPGSAGFPTTPAPGQPGGQPAYGYAPQQQPNYGGYAGGYGGGPKLPNQRPVGAPQRDPFAEAPTAQWYVRHSTGQQYGPAPAPMFQKWLNEGRIPGDGMVWREGWSDWQTAAAVFPQLSGPYGGGMAPPPVPPPAAAPQALDPFGRSASPFGATPAPYGAAKPAVPLTPPPTGRRGPSGVLIVILLIVFLVIVIVGAIVIANRFRQGQVVEDEGEEVARLQRPAVVRSV
ncbi:MAG: DUF4339 domain-containing protein [Pirellulales bacterium]